MRRHPTLRRRAVAIALLLLLAVSRSHGSVGDRLPEFRECVTICIERNCDSGDGPPIGLLHRLLLWTCPSECDYTCQHIVTDQREERERERERGSDGQATAAAMVQFHGKWPFYRFLGMQEPFSVLFSVLNLLAHQQGLAELRASIPASYGLRRYYLQFGYLGLASWTCSILFHARDFALTERLDYFAAGASVLYALYYTPVRIFRLAGRARRAWTAACLLAFAAHVAYLSFWRWDYGYNMAANVAVAAASNVLWSGFSLLRYRRRRAAWAAAPGLIVAWLVLAMSLELLDFAPWRRMLDAHSLWHLATVLPTVWWYNFLVMDARDDLRTARYKA